MTKNEFKQGDKVYMAYDPTRSAVVTDVCDEGKYDYYVKEDGSDFTQGCYEGELLDAKTAFQRELQALLHKYDAKIESCAEGTEDSWIDIYFGDECVICFDRNPQTCCATITANNIMEFDKE